MAQLNVRSRNDIYTYEGGKAKHIDPEKQLRRSVMACLLWENTFYEDGVSISDRISQEIKLVKPEIVAQIASEAREKYKLRHIPLWLVRNLTKLKYPISEILTRIIQRPDEITEFLAIYWKDGKEPLSSQVKRGLGNAFNKFDEYQFAKYNRDGNVKLRDALFLSHAKPKDEKQAELYKKIAENTLSIPDTWEVSLSTGKDKKETWTRLIKENKLGGMALLRNLRNMESVGVDESLIKDAILNIKSKRLLPFRFIAAARFASQFEPELERAMFKCIEGHEKLSGKTVLLVDVSGSMTWELSAKSKMLRTDAAYGLAMLLREICDNIEIWSFSNDCIRIPPRRGFALRDAIENSQHHSSTYLGKAVKEINANIKYNRLIVITDEQSHDVVSDPANMGYMINIASYQNGVGYGKWKHIDGFSESIVNWIIEYEKEFQEI